MGIKSSGAIILQGLSLAIVAWEAFAWMIPGYEIRAFPSAARARGSIVTLRIGVGTP
jgi:hypothetical protein